MSKEIYISSTPHETRLAVVENDQLAEIYYERENEYTLAGSIYNGKVTRVLPGMQSSFVDIGLERDAFLYVTDFMEDAAVDSAEFDTSAATGDIKPERSGDRGNDRGDRGRGDRGGRGRDRNRDERRPAEGAPQGESAAPAGDGEGDEIGSGAPGADGSRRWRGRRGRRRGRSGGAREGQPEQQNAPVTPEVVIEGGYDEEPVEIIPAEAAPAQEDRQERPRRDEGRRDGRRDGRGGRGREERGGREDRPSREAEYGGEQFAAKPAEPLLLPGESLARYRAADDAVQAGTADIHASDDAPKAKPSNIVEAPLTGWDGGAVLPGETIRPRNAGQGAARGESRGDRGQERGESRGDRGRDRGGRGRRDGRHEVRPGNPQQHEHQPGLTAVPAEPEKFAEEIFESEVGPEIAEDKAEAHEVPETAVVEAQPVAEAPPVEYEPEEASASYRVDPGAPSEYRHSVEDAPVVEAETVAEIAEPVFEVAESEPEAEQAAEIGGVHEYTTVQPTGEMLDQGTIGHLTESDPVAAAHSVPYTELAGEVRPAQETVEMHDPLAFAPGAGELEEEIIEEEEFEGGPFALHAEDGDLEDMEEETVEGAEALGSILRDMSIDEMTSADPDEDEEEGFSEGFAESDVEEESFEADGGEEFGGEEEVAADDAVADGAAPPQERRGRRDGRRGDRDRGNRSGGGGDRGRRDGRRGRSGPGGRSHAPQTPLPVISDLLKPGQEILVQIAKEPIAKKGARITSHIALPGRFLVFMPTVNHIGVSRKIASDEERRRLKHVLLNEKGDATGGFIVRTAADGANEEELRADLRFLINLWNGIKERSESSKSPALIYHDLNLVERILRDQVTDNFSAIWVDSEPEYERVLRFLQRFQPSLIRRVKLYSKDVPLFEQFGITEEINKALRSKVWLKSGGSIVINQTEALVAIDINTGKYVGKTARLEDTILKTNLDAIPEIVRQIRLRDLGGIIVIDFIDMDERKNRNKVLQALEDELKSDRAPSKVLPFNDFGLIAITRKRVKQSLERTLSTTCSICQGTGMVKSAVTVCNDIYIEMRKMHKSLDRGDIMLRVHPEVVKQLKSNGAKWLSEMEEMAGKTILVKSDPALHPEQFDIH
ncbi:MAG: Rne/Rng family ribonuclease [Acidobacteriaceae bacterium]|nr:Rne/Rng family ribonuclease [Acidobacteriaceae bacterium]